MAKNSTLVQLSQAASNIDRALWTPSEFWQFWQTPNVFIYEHYDLLEFMEFFDAPTNLEWIKRPEQIQAMARYLYNSCISICLAGRNVFRFYAFMINWTSRTNETEFWNNKIWNRTSKKATWKKESVWSHVLHPSRFIIRLQHKLQILFGWW